VLASGFPAARFLRYTISPIIARALWPRVLEHLFHPAPPLKKRRSSSLWPCACCALEIPAVIAAGRTTSASSYRAPVTAAGDRSGCGALITC
jgi:hypothetical protein